MIDAKLPLVYCTAIIFLRVEAEVQLKNRVYLSHGQVHQVSHGQVLQVSHGQVD
jgi:hypothetical protein